MAKKTLIDLVDTLIGNVLQGNVYSNLGNYVDKLGTMVPPKNDGTDIVGKNPAFVPWNHTDHLSSPSPVFDPKGIPSPLASPNPVFLPKGVPQDLQSPNPISMPDTGLHPLNFSGPDPAHPHSSVAGMTPGRSLFPSSDAIKMHDNRYAFINNQNVVDGPKAIQTPLVKRAEIYNTSPVMPPDVQQQIDNISTPLDTKLSRNEIYANSADGTKGTVLPPSDLTNQLKIMETNPDFKKGASFDETRRNNIYIPSETAKGIVSNIGGTPDSNPTLGDQQALLQKPPAPSLKFRGPNAGDSPNMERLRGFPLVDSAGFPLADKRDQKAADGIFQKGNFEGVQNPNLADLKNNLYNGGPPSVVNGGPFALTQGFIGPLRNFDIFAIAHWIRNVGSEVMFLPKWTNNQDDKKGSFQGPVRSSYPGGPNGAETIVKSTQWLAQNLLLASLNTGDTQAYGPMNLVWNPLSLLTAFLPARGVSPTERPTIGNMISTYKDNLEISVVASQISKLNPLGERLLVIRNGLYSQVAPVKRLQQLKSPIMKPGFTGDMNGSRDGGDTLDREIPQNLKNIAVTIADQAGGLKESAVKLLGVHTNLYTEDRPYNEKNAIYPLEKFENDYAQQDKAGLLLPKDDIKVSKMFSKKPFPGAGALDSGKDMTFIAKPTFAYFDKQGIEAKDTPKNVDVAFSVLDSDEGTVKSTISDEENYLPFMFQDLRDETDQFLYLRAFLKSFSETFTPEWNEDRYYGRAEPVPIYKGVIRTINLSFDMVAWSPKDLPVLYKKLSKLQSMVYPLYDEQGFFKAGPIIKMRVGDLIASGKDKGLPGYLTAIDLNYDRSIWNIKKDFKVPQHIEVSLGFTALHEANPGLYKDPADNKIVFGTGKIKKDGDSYKVETVSPENIRKIFQSIKGK